MTSPSFQRALQRTAVSTTSWLSFKKVEAHWYAVAVFELHENEQLVSNPGPKYSNSHVLTPTRIPSPMDKYFDSMVELFGTMVDLDFNPDSPLDRTLT